MIQQIAWPITGGIDTFDCIAVQPLSSPWDASINILLTASSGVLTVIFSLLLLLLQTNMQLSQL